MLRGAVQALTGGSSSSSKAQLQTERAAERLLAALQLGSACLALAAAEALNGQQQAGEAALRTAVGQLRWVLGVGAEDLERLSKAGNAEVSRV